jgi:hypothetical protein
VRRQIQLLTENHHHNHIMKSVRITFTLLAIALLGYSTARADDPLPSWNDGPAKRAIVDFVHSTTVDFEI